MSIEQRKYSEFISDELRDVGVNGSISPNAVRDFVVKLAEDYCNERLKQVAPEGTPEGDLLLRGEVTYANVFLDYLKSQLER